MKPLHADAAAPVSLAAALRICRCLISEHPRRDYVHAACLLFFCSSSILLRDSHWATMHGAVVSNVPLWALLSAADQPAYLAEHGGDRVPGERNIVRHVP